MFGFIFIARRYLLLIRIRLTYGIHVFIFRQRGRNVWLIHDCYFLFLEGRSEYKNSLSVCHRFKCPDLE